jgi:hypothetical protein
MTETISGAVASLRAAADMLADTARRLPTMDPGATGFGAGGPGRFGDLGRDLYLQWQRAIDARAREADAHGSRMHDLADLASRASGGFREAEESARGGQPEVS